jgi:hypothetical protein
MTLRGLYHLPPMKLLYIVVAMGPAVNCQPACICYRWFLVSVGVGVASIIVMGPTMVGDAEAKALALRAHVLDDEELQWPTVAQLVLPSLAQSTAA